MSCAIEGYAIADTPADGAALIDRLKTETIRWPLESYRAALAGLDPALVADLAAQWGAPESDPAIDDGDFVFKAIHCGHALIARAAGSRPARRSRRRVSRSQASAAAQLRRVLSVAASRRPDATR